MVASDALKIVVQGPFVNHIMATMHTNVVRLKDTLVGYHAFTMLQEHQISMTHTDVFIELHKKLDLELVALRAKYDRLELYIEQLARHAQVTL